VPSGTRPELASLMCQLRKHSTQKKKKAVKGFS
jgi:hypothetical protein